MSRLHICMVNLRAMALHDRNCPEIFGGAEVETFMLAQLFRDLGLRVTCLLGRGISDTAESPEGLELARLFDTPTLPPRLGLMRLWRALDRLDPDLCFMKLISPWSALVSTWCRIHGKRFIYRAANRRDLELAMGTGHWNRKQRLYFELTCHRKTTVLTQSGEQYAAFSRRTPLHLLHCLPNYYHSPSSANLDWEKRNGVLWVGHLMPVKSPDRLLELARAMPRIHFRVIASTQGPGVRIVDALASLANVEMLGSLPFHDVQPHFQTARILLNTSLTEGFPNTFLQAMQAGTPLATLGVDPDRMIRTHGLGLVEEDPARLATGLSRLIDSGPDWAATSARVSAYWQSTFGKQGFAEYYRRILVGDTSTSGAPR